MINFELLRVLHVLDDDRALHVVWRCTSASFRVPTARKGSQRPAADGRGGAATARGCFTSSRVQVQRARRTRWWKSISTSVRRLRHGVRANCSRLARAPGYAVLPDGRFVGCLPFDPLPLPTITVVLN